MQTKQLSVKGDQIVLRKSTLPEREVSLLQECERKMLEAGFEILRIPATLPRVFTYRQRRTGSLSGIKSLADAELVLSELSGDIERIALRIGMSEFEAPIPLMPTVVQESLLRARRIMPDGKPYVLFLPEWKPNAKDPVALYGDLELGYLWVVGQWDGHKDALRMERLLRKHQKS